MKIALFLDVDKTLTRKYIQQEYAQMLACDKEYEVVENKFQKDVEKADYSTTFGEEIVKLFSSKGFTHDMARSLATKIELQPWTPQLLQLKGVDIYLTSSGPSYFVHYLANKYGIPDDHICCSVYEFNAESAKIEACTRPADKVDKANLVKKHKDKYDLTIGVGDSPEHDGLFLDHCTIQLMTKPTRHYIYIPDLNSVIRLVEGLSQAFVVVDVEQGPLLPKLRSLTFAGWTAVIGTLIAFLGLGLAIGVELGKR